MTTTELQTHLTRYPSRRYFCRELLTAADIEPTDRAVEQMEQILSHQLRRESIPKAWAVAYKLFIKLKNPKQ